MFEPSAICKPATEAQRLQALRQQAVSQLTGQPDVGALAASPVDALSVLHDLASSPRTAADALALLHELQVQQVEIDLQAHALQESRAELQTALQRLVDRHEHLPVGCLVVDAGGLVIELNQTAAGILGMAHPPAPGRPLGRSLGSLLSIEDGRRMAAALVSLRAGLPQRSFMVLLGPPGQVLRPVLARLGLDAATGDCLVCLVPLE